MQFISMFSPCGWFLIVHTRQVHNVSIHRQHQKSYRMLCNSTQSWAGDRWDREQLLPKHRTPKTHALQDCQCNAEVTGRCKTRTSNNLSFPDLVHMSWGVTVSSFQRKILWQQIITPWTRNTELLFQACWLDHLTQITILGHTELE